MKLSEISDILSGFHHGDDVNIERLGCLDTEYENAILYVENEKYLDQVLSKKPVAVVVQSGLIPQNIPFIEVENPKLAFIRLLELFAQSEQFTAGANTDSIIDAEADIGKDAVIMQGAVVMKGALIGENSIIYPNCVIEPNVSIGAGTILYSGVVIRTSCIVGENCRIHSGTVIGSDGYGYYEDNGQIIKIPQIGIVKIGDRVEIGANCCIDRATVGTTEIGNDTKLDNLIQIAHNVKIGERCYIAAQAGISGSVVVGNHATILGQVGIGDHISIAPDTVIMGQSGIHNDVKEADILFGTPARSVKEHHRIHSSLKYVPELLKRVKLLEKKIFGDKS